MKKIIFVLIVLAGFATSCTKNFDDYGTDQKHPEVVPGGYLFANAEKALADQIASTNVNLNVWKLWAQYWTETTYTDEANYDIVTRTIADNTFQVFYRDILVDLKEARRIITAEAPILEGDVINKQNRLYIIELLECYAYNHLLETFGDIPYSEALDIENISPKYDDAKTVYLDLLSKAQTAVNGLDPSVGSYGDNDIYHGGDVAMWIKFGNALQIKMAITLADVDPGTSQSYIESAYEGSYAEGEGTRLLYEGGTNSNPLYLDMVASGRDDFVPANTIVDIMLELEDPRIDDYFVQVDTTVTGGVEGVYEGGIYGESSPFGQLSHVAAPIQDPKFPVALIDYTEIAFYLAEAASRGFSVGNDAATWYNSAVTSSFLTWGGTEAEATAYLAKPEVAYSASNWKEIIGTQAWLAFYTRGMEGYTSWRRLDFPILNIAPQITSYEEIPVRFTYPINEQTLNADNYNAASDAIGEDLLTTKLFWDIN